MSEGRELDVDAILSGLDEPTPEGHRSGLVALVGRPNVGKSTLLNRLVGEKVAIVTPVPGTTRNAIRGVVTRADAQLVLLDTPGLAKPRTLLARRLNDLVRQTWQGVDAVCLLVDVAGGVGTGDEFLARELSSIDSPVVAVANKEDLVGDKGRLLPQLERLASLGRFAEVVPVSALTGLNVDLLTELLIGLLPEGPRLFPAGRVGDQPEHQLVAEILREKLIRRMQDELPHAIAVTVETIEPLEGRPDMMHVDAVVYVERDSQKGIVIGKGGLTLRDAGTEARPEIEVLLGAGVHLTTRVKVAPRWQSDPRRLERFGY